jgi:hypothetical protein
MPKLRNVIYLLLFSTLIQVLIIGVMHVFEFSYKQAANWVVGITSAIITIGIVCFYIQTKKIQRSFIDTHEEVNFSKDTVEMLSRYKSLIEGIDDPHKKTKLLKEFNLIVAIKKSRDESYTGFLAGPTTINSIEQDLQRLRDIRKD